MGKNSPGAVESALLQDRQGVRLGDMPICEADPGSGLDNNRDRSQFIQQTALAQRVGGGAVSGADSPRPH